MHTPLAAGTAIVDISPSEGVSLGGYPHHPRPNTGVHDPLNAACLVLDDGTTSVAIVSMDLLMYSKRYVREVRAEAAKATGIPAANIAITASHTHSAPRASAMFSMDAIERGQGPDAGFVEELNRKLIDLIVEASSHRFQATIGASVGYCGREEGVGGNRRHPRGTADPEVPVIAVRDESDTVRAIFMKYALHPTFLHSDNFEVSADYPGYLRAHLAKAYPEANLLFAQGTSGNQSPRYFRSGKTFKEAERVGTAIAREVGRVVEGLEFTDSAPLAVFSREVEIDLRTLPDRTTAEARTETARDAWQKLKASGADERDVWNAELRFLGAEDTLALVMLEESGDFAILNEDWPVEVQVMGIGETRLVFLPGELFVELGLTIQYRAPFKRCVVVELANGVLPGYAATARAYATGGYEAGASMLSANSGEQIVEVAADLLEESLGEGS